MDKSSAFGEIEMNIIQENKIEDKAGGFEDLSDQENN